MKVTGSSSLAIVNTLEEKIIAVSKKEIIFDLTKFLSLTFIFFFSVLFLMIILESIFYFSVTVRTVFYWTWISTFVTTFVYLVLSSGLKFAGIIKPLDIIPYAAKVGNNYPEIKDELSNSLSIYEDVEKKPFTIEFVNANLNYINSKTSSKDLSSFIKFSSLKNCFLIIAGIVLLYILSFSIFPSPLFSSVNRIINHNFIYLKNDIGLKFDVYPGNVSVPRGESLDITVKITTTKPYDIDAIDIYTKEETKDRVQIISKPFKVEKNKDGAYLLHLENISSNIKYYAEYAGYKSDEYNIAVSDEPVLKSFSVTVNPPSYTGQPSKTLLINEGNITCIEGSRIHFELISNKELKEAGVEFNSLITKFNINENHAAGELTAAVSGSYKFVLKDQASHINKNANIYTINVVPDSPPSVTIIEPEESNKTITALSGLLVRGRISDDYGFSKLLLNYKKESGSRAAGDKFSSLNIPIMNPTATMLEVPYMWSLSSLGLQKGDRVEYYLEVFDNTGKSARSESKIIQYLSLSEILKNTEQINKEIRTEISNAFQDLNNVQKDLMEMKKEAQRDEDLGLNDPKKKEELENKIDNLKNELNTTQQKLEQSMNEMQKKNQLDDKTLDKYMELQKLFNKINTPELQEMLKKIQDALKKNNDADLKDAMKNFKFDEEAFKKYMDQALDLMKKIENLQKFGDLTQKLDEITKKQDALKEETKKSDKNDPNKMNDLSQKQKDIQDKLKDFNEELKKLIDQMNAMKDKMDTGDLDKLKKEMEKRDPEKKMDNSSKDLQKGDKSSSEKKQEEISNDLNEMNKKMQDALENMMSANDSDKLKEKLEGLKKQLDELSKRQKELKDKTQELGKDNKQGFDNNKQQQGQLQSDLSKSIDDMMNLSKSGMQVSPEMGKELGNAYNKMGKAKEDLEGQKKDDATGKQGDAKNSLDNASKMLGDQIGKMGKGKDGKEGKDGKGGKGDNGRMQSLMEQLSKMISQQQGLSGQMGKLGKNGKEGNDGNGENGNNLTEEQKGQMQKLKMEQEQISKSLEQLNEEFKKEQERSGEKLLGDLSSVQKEMQEVIKDLEQNRINDKTLEKQNKILSRMLDARLSQREKDFEPKRESRGGNDIVRTSPPEIILSGPGSYNALKEDLLKLQKQGLTDDYEALITKYLMLLRNGQ